MPDQTEPKPPMTRSDAISQVIGYIDQIDGEWGPVPGGTADEAIEVLTALGVTHDELVAHNLIREGYWYQLVREIAGIAAISDADTEVLRRIRTELATVMDYRNPEDNHVGHQLRDLANARNARA